MARKKNVKAEARAELAAAPAPTEEDLDALQAQIEEEAAAEARVERERRLRAKAEDLQEQKKARAREEFAGRLVAASGERFETEQQMLRKAEAAGSPMERTKLRLAALTLAVRSLEDFEGDHALAQLWRGEASIIASKLGRQLAQ